MNRVALAFCFLVASQADASLIYLEDRRELLVYVQHPLTGGGIRDDGYADAFAPAGFGDWSASIAYDDWGTASIESSLGARGMAASSSAVSSFETCAGCIWSGAIAIFSMRFRVTETSTFELAGYVDSIGWFSFSGWDEAQDRCGPATLLSAPGNFSLTGILEAGETYCLSTSARADTRAGGVVTQSGTMNVRLALAPEPGTLALVAMGLATLSRRRR